jgi:predicted porin
MKKSVLAVTLLAASSAFAQSNVTVYGVVDASIAHEKNGGTASALRLDSGSQSGSRLGFKGTEDLGGGLKANFVLEAGFNLDDGTSAQGALFGRQAFVGLSGSFGAVNLGRQKAPMYDVMDKLDPFKIGMAGDANRLFRTTVRINNAVTYFTPVMSGFAANAMYATGESQTSSSGNKTVGLAMTYDNGPLELAFAYNKTYDATGNDSARKTLIGGVYNFGPAKGHVAYMTNKGVGKINSRIWMLGATLPVSKGVAVLVDYTRVSDRFLNNADANQIALGMTYDLSKRTNLYTSYSRTSNDGAARYNAAVNGATDKFFNVGVRHKF